MNLYRDFEFSSNFKQDLKLKLEFLSIFSIIPHINDSD